MQMLFFVCKNQGFFLFRHIHSFVRLDRASASHFTKKTCENAIHDKRAEYKSEEVYTDKSCVRDHLIDRTEQGKCAIKIRADVEHIEGLVDTEGKECMVYNDVQSHCDKAHHNKDLCAAEEMLNAKSISVSDRIEDTHKDLRAVVHHGLYADAGGFRKYVTGVAEHRKTGKEREGHHISDARITYLIIPCKCDYGQNIEGRRAELEGECIPSVIPDKRTVLKVESVYKLLVYLKSENHYPHKSGQHVHCPIRGILKELAHKEGQERYRKNARNMKEPIALGSRLKLRVKYGI